MQINLLNWSAAVAALNPGIPEGAGPDYLVPRLTKFMLRPGERHETLIELDGGS